MRVNKIAHVAIQDILPTLQVSDPKILAPTHPIRNRNVCPIHGTVHKWGQCHQNQYGDNFGLAVQPIPTPILFITRPLPIGLTSKESMSPLLRHKSIFPKENDMTLGANSPQQVIPILTSKIIPTTLTITIHIIQQGTTITLVITTKIKTQMILITYRKLQWSSRP